MECIFPPVCWAAGLPPWKVGRMDCSGQHAGYLQKVCTLMKFTLT